MAYKCGDCGKEHASRKEWLTHIIEAHNSVILDGEERDIELCKKILNEKIAKGDSKAQTLMEKY